MISIVRGLLNSQTRLFVLGDPGREKYLQTAGMFRVIFDRQDNRLILRERMITRPYYTIRDIQPGDTLAVVYGEFGDPSRFRAADIWMVLHGLKVRRSWMPMVSALSPDDVAPLEYWIEFSFTTWETFFDEHHS